MKRLSPVAALMLVNVYCCILLGLVLRALDPATDWADGFPALMLFFCCVTVPSPDSQFGPASAGVVSRPASTTADRRLTSRCSGPRTAATLTLVPIHVRRCGSAELCR